MSQSFELTKEGVKLSYVRFLSDSAAGYIFLLLFGVAFVLKLPMPFVGTSWLNIIPPEPTTDVKIFLFLVSFLIATPLGLILNGISWFALGTLSGWMLNIWVKIPAWLSYPISSTRKSYHADKTTEFFRCRTSAEELYRQANYYEIILIVYFPTCYEQIEPVRGLKRFTRSLAFIALLVSIYCFLTINNFSVGALAIVCFILLLLFNSMLEYYQWLFVLFAAYTLSSKIPLENNPSREEIVQNLIETSARLRST